MEPSASAVNLLRALTGQSRDGAVGDGADRSAGPRSSAAKRLPSFRSSPRVSVTGHRPPLRLDEERGLAPDPALPPLSVLGGLPRATAPNPGSIPPAPSSAARAAYETTATGG